MKIVEPLTDRKIKAAKPAQKSYPLFDGGGLYLEVAPSGSKLWRLKYKFEGKERRMSIGPYPEVSLAQARARRAEYKSKIKNGVDPLAERRETIAAKKAKELEEFNTFERVARMWFEKQSLQWSDGYRKRVLSRLESQLFPYIGKTPIARLETADYLTVVQIAEKRSAIETAHRLAQFCSQIARFAIHAGIIKYDTASLVSGALQKIQRKHFAAITRPEDFGRLLLAIDDYSCSPAISHALRIMPYVFLRSKELRGAKWSELDLAGGVWVVPAGRMKMRREHVVPLAAQVVRLFQSMRDYSANSEYVFPSAHSNTRCISDVGLLNALRRMGYAKGEMSIHGFRSSFSSMCNQKGYNRDWIELQLAHADKNAIRAAYNRADYLPERTRMMQEWADYLDSLRNPT